MNASWMHSRHVPWSGIDLRLQSACIWQGKVMHRDLHMHTRQYAMETRGGGCGAKGSMHRGMCHVRTHFNCVVCVLAGEKVVIQGKYAKDVVVPNWRAMFAMAGNESFTTREQANAGNRLTRRTVPFHFGQKVKEHNRGLLGRMKEEMPVLIWVCSWALRVRHVMATSTSCPVPTSYAV